MTKDERLLLLAVAKGLLAQDAGCNRHAPPFTPPSRIEFIELVQKVEENMAWWRSQGAGGLPT